MLTIKIVKNGSDTGGNVVGLDLTTPVKESKVSWQRTREMMQTLREIAMSNDVTLTIDGRSPDKDCDILSIAEFADHVSFVTNGDAKVVKDRDGVG